MQAGGRRFDPVCLHHHARAKARGIEHEAPMVPSWFFDIVYRKYEVLEV